ncbi:MAG: adenosylcobinamide-GDP ribazoletransferase [Victivallales bacterium]|jgi:adenosylcobinamide-GDP ribazoletransferase|nr:adenosylcobinamide-GDP ribazoletransferase [Victivallales bacterium]
MRTFFAAISMLSIIPLGKFNPTESELGKSHNFFPVVGALFGALFLAVALLLQRYCPILPTAMLLVLLPEVLTKALHLDGLSDTADGFLSGQSRERKLEIMRDSHVGTMGVAAIFGVLGLKFTLFASISPGLVPPAIALMMLAGRSGIVFYIAMSRYARSDGKGAIWFKNKPVNGVILAWLLPAFAGWCFLGISGVLLPIWLILFAWLWSGVTKRVIGGATGDTIGGFEELCELLTLVVVAL